MSLDYKELQEIEEKYSEKKEATPYGRLNLRDFSDDKLDGLEIENYKDELKKLHAELTKHFSNPDEKKPNKIIAIVGVTGVGKTTIVSDLIEKIDQFRAEFTAGKKSNFIFMVGGKIGLFAIKDFLGTNFKRGIFVLDDAHMPYYPNLQKNKKIQKDVFEDIEKDFTNSVIITTWNVFGLNYALSKNPDLIKKFDKILWVEGLHKSYLTGLIRERAQHYAIERQKFKFDQVFDTEGASLAIKKSNNNPRIFIHLFDLAIKEAYKQNKDYVSIDIFENVIAKLEVKAEIRDLMGDKIIFNSLSVPRVSIKNLESLTNLDRTTILKRINKIPKNILGEVKSKKTKSKQNRYELNCFLKTQMEKVLFEDLKERINSFVDIEGKLM